MKTYLNLGCGQRFHKDWSNIDFVSQSEYVQAHNLLQGIPFSNESFEVVYHSHVLEHFSKTDGKKFIQECYRVLKPNGIIRIAVPDLAQIINEYTKNLQKAIEGDKKAQQDYEWIMLEMYDQVVRNKSGGEMADYIFQPVIPNEEYVFARLGEEAKNLRRGYLNSINNPTTDNRGMEDNRNIIRKVLSNIKQLIKLLIFKNKTIFFADKQYYTNIGKFRLGGEIHQWMYDSYSLSKLLSDSGFMEVKIQSALESRIKNWNSYELETKDSNVLKPDSLFIEAIKI